MKPNCQPVQTKLSTSYVIFYGKIALRPISSAVKTPVATIFTAKVPSFPLWGSVSVAGRFGILT